MKSEKEKEKENEKGRPSARPVRACRCRSTGIVVILATSPADLLFSLTSPCCGAQPSADDIHATLTASSCALGHHGSLLVGGRLLDGLHWLGTGAPGVARPPAAAARPGTPVRPVARLHRQPRP